MTTTLQPFDRSIELPDPALLLDEVLDYGPSYTKLKRWSERTEDQQNRLTCALKAFRTWRMRMGESFDDDPWAMPPPEMKVLIGYLVVLSSSSEKWQHVSLAALRLYCLHHNQPQLFRMVELKQVRAILITR